MPEPSEDLSQTPNRSSIDAYETRVDYPTTTRINTYG
jgi:hypothetical protein